MAMLLRKTCPTVFRIVLAVKPDKNPLKHAERLFVNGPGDDEGNFEQKHFENRSPNESLELKRARLIYQSRKRGILENDLLLSTFVDKYLDSWSPKELEIYDRMINTVSNEWDLFYWATGKKPIPEEFRSPVMEKFVEHVKNEERVERLRQPDL